MLGYSSRDEVERAELAAAEAAQGEICRRDRREGRRRDLADDELRAFAVAAGAAAFKVNCVQCHGSGAAGSAGYPNLNDDDWLWGGTPEQIHQTIAHGIRFAADAGHPVSEMPAFGDILDADQIAQVSAYVASLSGRCRRRSPVEPGAEVFADNCAACHGDDGKGNRELGAPDLTDAIWLYGSSEAAIAAQVRAPTHGVMPAWSERLGDTTVKELAVYVHSLGGGE